MNQIAHKIGFIPKRIAIFRALQIGDLICSIPAIRSIKRAYPQSQITLIGLPWSQAFTQQFSAYFSDFIRFPGYPGLPEQPFDIKLLHSFITKVHKKQFDLVIQMQGNGSVVNPLVQLFNGKITAGYFRKEDYYPGEYFLEYPQHLHEIKKHLRLVEFLGIKSTGTQLEFPVEDEEYENLKSIYKKYKLQPENYVVIHPGARAPERRWPAAKFALIANALMKRGIKVVVTGTNEENEVIKEFKNNLNFQAVDLSGKIRLGTLGALLENASLLIANDTGVSHIAAALQTPSVIIFSPFSDPRRWAPLNTRRHIRISYKESKNPKHILTEAEKMLLSRKKSKSRFLFDKPRVSI